MAAEVSNIASGTGAPVPPSPGWPLFRTCMPWPASIRVWERCGMSMTCTHTGPSVCSRNQENREKKYFGAVVNKLETKNPANGMNESPRGGAAVSDPVCYSRASSVGEVARR